MGDQKVPEVEISDLCISRQVANSDAAIFTISRQAGEGIDRSIRGEFGLTELELKMLQSVSAQYHAAGKPVIVVINSGSVIETSSWRGIADAILVAWQPGEEGGNSVVDILTGKVCPSGRLTMTWPIFATDHPSTSNFPVEMPAFGYENLLNYSRDNIQGRDFTNHEEDIWVGYRYFDTWNKDVAYPFGYGLSYTTFEFGKPTVRKVGDKITVSVSVKNTGKVAGKEVAQVYVAAPDGSIEKPEKELKAFGKTNLLQPGETQTLQMTIAQRDLASFDEANSRWIADAGNYDFMVGANIADIKGTAQLKLTEYTEKTNNALAPKVKLNLLKRN
jgi:beta-glucosidase